MEKNGIGKEYFSEGEIEYTNGEPSGKGKEYHKNGELKFEGEYINRVRNGKGKEYYDVLLINIKLLA